MARISSENLRPSTVVRYDHVNEVYTEVVRGMGKYACLVTKAYIYELIRARTGLSTKTIARALRHSHGK